MLRRALLAACLLLAPHAGAKTTREADLAYREARTAHQSLKKDTARRKFRHHWLNVADKYEAVARLHPRTDRAPEALFNAAQMLEELSRISRAEEDLLRAAGDYRRLVELAPKHPLGDDAALEVARIQADLLGRPGDARRTAEKALKQLPRGDKAKELRALLASLPADKGRKGRGGDEPREPASKQPRQALLAAMARASDGEAERTASAAAAGPTAPERPAPARPEEVAGLRGGVAPVVGPSAQAARTPELSAGREALAAALALSQAAVRDERAAPGSSIRPPARADSMVRAPEVPAERDVAAAPGGTARAAAPPADGARSAAEAAARNAGDVTSPAGTLGEAVRVAAGPSSAAGGAAQGAPRTADPGAVPATGIHPGAEIPAGLPVVVAEPSRRAEPPATPEKKVGAKEAKARIKAMRGVKDPEVTLAEQLGLKVRRVVIDPGHGGHDSGALGPSGKKEKDVSLAISKKVAQQLRNAGLEVLLTREKDTFVRLEDRAAFANEHRGDLFISIHCNSATSRKLRGVETYSLNIASDRYSIRLAARENASSERSISDLQFILADLATKANTEESSRLATRVQGSLVSSLSAKDPGLRDLGHKQALFYVLLGAKMPAILVETSFISNPEDEKKLASGKYQDQVASAISAGVRGFLDDRERVAHVE